MPKNELKHYGTPRHSGRYPWGSGDQPYQSSQNFLAFIAEMRKGGMTDTDIAKTMGISTTTYRARNSIAKAEQRAAQRAEVLRLVDKGMSNVAIGKQMGLNESSVRNLRNDALADRADMARKTADMLKRQVAEKTYLDVGANSERFVGVSREKMNVAIAMLKEEGYDIKYLKVEQQGNIGKYTSMKILTAPGVGYKELYDNKKSVRQIDETLDNDGSEYNLMRTPKSISSSRVAIRYDEDGGTNKDGVIELRRGVNDLSLGEKNYAQVRIAVDGTHYLKGMAIYSDDIPKGKDVIFNTNKSKSTPMIGEKDNTVLKPLNNDKDLPFGSIVRQKADMSGKDISALNIVGYKDESGEEGAWGRWSKSLSAQMLSKQSPELVKRQLDIALKMKQEGHDEIMSLTNPAVKKKLLESFADECDSGSVHMKAAALPRQRTHVLLPLPGIKEDQCYTTNYQNGEKVALIRYPHGGIFEIPELTVNNRGQEGKKTLGTAKDAIGIHPKVAERLSGADFDGDTVIVFPTKGINLRTSAPLDGLRNFSPKEAYPAYEGMKRMTSTVKQQEMGKVSNLITDMTIKGAKPDEIARAVRHSMVVIDAEKHNLNYKQSAIDNGISQLKEKYQGGANRGASTIVSRASSVVYVDQRKPRPFREGGPIDPLTGKKVYVDTGETYNRYRTDILPDGSRVRTPIGEPIKRKSTSTRMAETDDARTLSSGERVEALYANHANTLKSLGNQSRKETLQITPAKYNPSAKKAYAEEVNSLNAKLDNALRNSPRERQAQLLAGIIMKAKRDANPNIDPSELGKLRNQSLAEARSRTGAGKERVNITVREWEAIQAGAISNNKLSQILDNTDLDRVRELATPRPRARLTSATLSRAKAMLNAGQTQAEVANALGVSITTILEEL